MENIMTPTGPQDVDINADTIDAPDALFEIEEGHFGPHLPRPNREALLVGAGTVFTLIGFYLPWLTIQQQTFNQGQFGPGATSVTTQIGGWSFASSGLLHAPTGSLNGIGLLLLVGMPALAALLALAMNIIWYRRRATALTCGLALSALGIGLSVLFGESSLTLLLAMIYTFLGGGGVISAQIGFGVPLMYLGYIGLVAGTLTMCARYWRHGAQGSYAATQ